MEYGNLTNFWAGQMRTEALINYSMSGRESLEWEVKWNYVGWGGIDTIASGKQGLIHIQWLSLHIRSTTKNKNNKNYF